MPEISSADLQRRYDISPVEVCRIADAFAFKDDLKIRRGFYDADLFKIAFDDYKTRPQSLMQSAASPTRATSSRKVKSGDRSPPTFTSPPAVAVAEGSATGATGGTIADRATELRVAKLTAEARRAELITAQAAGELITREAARTAAVAIVVEARQRLEAIGAKVAPNCVGLDVVGITAAIDNEIKAALADLARLEAVA